MAIGLFVAFTSSRKVNTMVTDVSRSMNFSMVPRSNPTDSRDKPFDMPRQGEDSRLDVAKRDQAGSGALYLSRCTDASWLAVDLRQEESLNRFAVGATGMLHWSSGGKS